jgi:hypothetical protein
VTNPTRAESITTRMREPGPGPDRGAIRVQSVRLSAMADVELADAIRRVRSLRSDLRDATQRDLEREIQGPAIQEVDAVLSAARPLIPDGDPVLDRLADVVSPESVEAGEPVRAFDLLIVVDQVYNTLDAEDRRTPG